MNTLKLGIISLFCVVSVVSGEVKILGTVGPFENVLCADYKEVVKEYSAAVYDFAIKFFKVTGYYSNYQFVATPYSTWITLAAIAEGADELNKKHLFDLLRLPEDPCIRQMYYKAATSRFIDTEDISFQAKRNLFVNEGVYVNQNWADFVKQNSLLEVDTTPVHSPILNGNSVLLNSLEYNGLWTTAFDGAYIERAPFYDNFGHVIGSVDLMKTNVRAKIGYEGNLGVKLVTIPLGRNGDYSLLLFQSVNNVTVESVVNRMTSNTPLELVASLHDTIEPINIAIPRFALNSQIDVRAVLESLGVTSIWTDASATRYISEPPAFPSSYIQRTAVTISNDGVHPAKQQYKSDIPGTPGLNLKEFIADRPFFFVIFDRETYSGPISGVFSQPTYQN